MTLAQHLLVADGCALVWTFREGNSFRDCHGFGVVGDNQPGDRPQANAEDLRDGRAEPGRARIEAVSVRAVPASLPYVLTRFKQGWAFAWRSLIAGEMIFVRLGLGQLLMMGRDLNDMSQVLAVMILIIAIGYIVDGLMFKTFERRLQYKWGLTPAT
jgi:hypothetical protein